MAVSKQKRARALCASKGGEPSNCTGALTPPKVVLANHISCCDRDRLIGPTMHLETQTQSGQVVIAVKEERLDAHNSSELKDRILRILEEGGRRLVIDLADVNFIDSSGLGALLSGYKNTNQRSGTFILSGLQPRVRSMFELTRLNRVFEIYPRLQEAISSHTVT